MNPESIENSEMNIERFRDEERSLIEGLEFDNEEKKHRAESVMTVFETITNHTI